MHLDLGMTFRPSQQFVANQVDRVMIRHDIFVNFLTRLPDRILQRDQLINHQSLCMYMNMCTVSDNYICTRLDLRHICMRPLTSLSMFFLQRIANVMCMNSLKQHSTFLSSYGCFVILQQYFLSIPLTVNMGLCNICKYMHCTVLVQLRAHSQSLFPAFPRV